MTETHESKVVTETKQVLIGRRCDWCGGDMLLRAPSGKHREGKLSFSHGDSAYYEYVGYVEGWRVDDLCDDCVPKLRKLLEGAGIHVTDFDY